MCIGIFLQYGLENNFLDDDEDYNDGVKAQSNIIMKEGINPLPKEKIFCLICGGNNLQLTLNETAGKLGLKWVQTCDDCNHKTLYNYCGNKSCRCRLIKHGPYWTYHATQSLQPFNIKCPSCGEIADPKDLN
jgi:hypothetical protein